MLGTVGRAVEIRRVGGKHAGAAPGQPASWLAWMTPLLAQPHHMPRAGGAAVIHQLANHAGLTRGTEVVIDGADIKKISNLHIEVGPSPSV